MTLFAHFVLTDCQYMTQHLYGSRPTSS